MKKIPMNTSGKMGFPKTPSYWIGEPKYINAMEITITAGGGMGGSLWYEYVLPDIIPSNEIVEFCDINNKKILINTRYIVSVREVTVVEFSTMCSNQNFYKTPTVEKFRCQIPNGTKIMQTENYADKDLYVYIDLNEK